MWEGEGAITADNLLDCRDSWHWWSVSHSRCSSFLPYNQSWQQNGKAHIAMDGASNNTAPRVHNTTVESVLSALFSSAEDEEDGGEKLFEEEKKIGSYVVASAVTVVVVILVIFVTFRLKNIRSKQGYRKQEDATKGAMHGIYHLPENDAVEIEQRRAQLTSASTDPLITTKDVSHL